MINEDAFKTIIHEDGAFEELLKRTGPEPVRSALQKMRAKLSTQIARFGDERPEWFRKANSLLALVNHRLDQVKVAEDTRLQDYKEFIQEVATALYNADYTSNAEPDLDDIDALYEWLDGTGL